MSVNVQENTCFYAEIVDSAARGALMCFTTYTQPRKAVQRHVHNGRMAKYHAAFDFRALNM